MADIFISYKREDEVRVAVLHEALRSAGLDIWWDKQIGGGDRWRKRIQTELDAAKCVIVVWSRASTADGGDFVMDEANWAKQRGVLLQVRIDDVKLPLGFGEFQAVDALGGRFQIVVAAAKAMINGHTALGPEEAAAAPPAAPVRNRAVRLLETFFANDGERERRTVFNRAFGECERNPAAQIEYAGSAADFAGHAVDRLLTFGCAARGHHSLSLLLATMAEIRGRQTDPDYHDLEGLLDTGCELPTRAEEQHYLERLLAETEEKARLYSPLHGLAETRRSVKAQALLRPWEDDPDIALLRHGARGREASEKPEWRDYDDILSAFSEVPRAALLGAPGGGKSTTLRKLAVDLARRAQADSRAPLPLLASLGNWRGDETLAEFLAGSVPEIGWAIDGLNRARRLVLLLDGLNEVPTGKRTVKAADVREVAAKLGSGTALIVSCRREDYTGDLDLGLDTLTLEPLSPQRIRAALRQWVDNSGEAAEVADQIFWQLAGDEQLGGVFKKWMEAGGDEGSFWTISDPWKNSFERMTWEHREIWLRHIPNPRSLLLLASNPFMLTMLFLVWVAERALPQNRGDLFTRFINRLLSREGLLVRDATGGQWTMKPEGEQLLKGLADLAWGMQRKRGESHDVEGDDGVLTVARVPPLWRRLGTKLCSRKRWTGLCWREATNCGSGINCCKSTSLRRLCSQG